MGEGEVKPGYTLAYMNVYWTSFRVLLCPAENTASSLPPLARQSRDTVMHYAGNQSFMYNVLLNLYYASLTR